MPLSRFFDQFYDGCLGLPLYIYYLARFKYKGVENLESMLEKCATREEGELFVYNNVNLDRNFFNFTKDARGWFSRNSNPWESYHLDFAWYEVFAMQNYFENCSECKDYVTVDHCPSEEQKKFWSRSIYSIYRLRRPL